MHFPVFGFSSMLERVRGVAVWHGAALGLFSVAPAGMAADFQDWLVETVAIPALSHAQTDFTPLVIAVVDDGMDLDSPGIREVLCVNLKEAAVVNGLDDDGNGRVDDIHGWDVADDDSNVNPAREDADRFTHGTFLAQVLIQTMQYAYAENAPKHYCILPVKAVADHASRPLVTAGYQGIQYALDANADIVLTAWGAPPVSASQTRILAQAERQGVLIVASAGNAYGEVAQYPAAYPPVLAVTALNTQGLKSQRASYGNFVDIAAPGEGISSPLLGSAEDGDGGTSQAAAITTAAAAIVWSAHRKFTAKEVTACLQDGASVHPSLDRLMQGKLGAGKLHIARARQCPLLTDSGKAMGELTKPLGFLVLDQYQLGKREWLIQPEGNFKGMRFVTSTPLPVDVKGELSIHAGKSASGQLLARYPLSALPEELYLPHPVLFVQLRNVVERSNDRTVALLKYVADTIDYRSLYCKPLKRIVNEGIIEDGSAAHAYAPDTDCKWLVSAPKGKRIHVRFLEIDTQSRTDLLYFFGGKKPLKEMLRARLSGSEIPRAFTSWGNEMLIWFVSDNHSEYQGWKLEITFVEPPPVVSVLSLTQGRKSARRD